jgi:hypothetical protein
MKIRGLPPIALLTKARGGMDITERKRLEQEILVVSEGGQRRIGRHLGNFVPASRTDPIVG